MKPYEILEHTADVGLKVGGATLEELFENASKGMFAIITGRKRKGRKGKFSQEWTKIKIKNQAGGFEELLVDWLSELLYLFNKEGILFSDFKINELNKTEIFGEAFGKKINLSQNTLQTEIKACTFHGLKIEENKKRFYCNIIFDV